MISKNKPVYQPEMLSGEVFLPHSVLATDCNTGIARASLTLEHLNQAILREEFSSHLHDCLERRSPKDADVICVA